jgi:hypothetical protein
MAGFIERKPKEGATPKAPKEFKAFTLPSVKLDTLADVDTLIEAFTTIGATDVVKFLQNKTAKFR